MLVAKVVKLEKKLVTLCDVSNVTDKKLQGLESHLTLDANAIAHLGSLVKGHHSNSLFRAAESGELLQRLNELERKVPEAVASALQLQACISFWTGGR